MKTNYPDSLTIQQYLEGKLDPEAAHQLEKQALDDPFLWDALEGYSVYKDPAADLSILQRQLHERIVHTQENKKVFDLSWQRLSVAAAAAVMFVSAGILFWMNSHNAPERLASEIHKPVEVNVIDRDSVEAIIQSKDEPAIASPGKKEIDLDRPKISSHRPSDALEKKAVISPEPESTAAAPVSESQSRTLSASRQTKVARIEEDGKMNQATVGDNKAPKSGWLAYTQYLTVNARKFKANPPLTGSVLLSFRVGSDGKLTNINVIRGLNEAHDKEALRIVRNGSEWIPSPDGKVYDGLIEVKFQR